MKDDRGDWTSENLPAEWEWVSFDQFFEDVTDSARKLPQKDYAKKGAFPVVDQGEDFVGGYTDNESMVHRTSPPTIVFGDHTRCVKYIDFPFVQGADGVKVLKPKEGIDARYGYYALRAITLPDKGYSRHMKFLRASSFPVCSLENQRRIVASLDGLLVSSRNVRDELDHIPKLVRRYKQAVLAAAFRGDLTANWRMSNNCDARLFLSECGIETLREQHSGLLPKGWAWVAAGSLCAIKGGITLGKKRAPGIVLIDLPYLRVANVQRGWLNLDEIKIVSVTQKEAEALYLKPDDVLMNEGGDRDKLGRGWVWDGQIHNCIHQNHVFRLRPRTKGIPGRYISYYANEFGQRYFVDEGKQTTNLASISLSKISALPVPIASPAEMAVIVGLIEGFFSQIDKLAEQATKATDLLGRLNQAILAKAFRGEPFASNAFTASQAPIAAE